MYISPTEHKDFLYMSQKISRDSNPKFYSDEAVLKLILLQSSKAEMETLTSNIGTFATHYKSLNRITVHNSYI